MGRRRPISQPGACRSQGKRLCGTPTSYKLREHLGHIKSYLLLGKGDFVQYLMEHLAPQLSRPSSQARAPIDLPSICPPPPDHLGLLGHPISP